MEQHSYKERLLELIQPKKDLWEKSFKDVRVMLLTIGFSGSGSSLLGYLLTAHSNMVIADQPAIRSGEPVALDINDINGISKKEGGLYSADLNKIFNVILGVDYIRWLAVKEKRENNNILFAQGTRQKRYILVPNQYQGRFEILKVLGIKCSTKTTEYLSSECQLTTLKKRLEERGIRLKFILTVRNPYDMIGNKTGKWNKYKDSLQKPITTKAISYVEELSEKSIKILKQIDPQDIFISRHEEMVADPRLQLTKICEFAQVSASPDYLDSCASCVHKEPRKRQSEFDWTSEQREKVESLIEQYDFLSGYDWES